MIGERRIKLYKETDFIAVLSNNRPMTTEDVRTRVGCSYTWAMFILRELTKKGIILMSKESAPGPHGYKYLWKLVDKN